MSAWTDGKTEVLLGPHGLSVHRGDEVHLILSTEQLGGALAPKKGKAGFSRLRSLAVTSGAKHAFTITAKRELVRTTLAAKPKTLRFPWTISALAPAHGQRVFAAYVTGTKARAMTSLVIGSPPANPKATWEHVYESDKPKKVKWPEGLLWDKAQWSRKTRWTVDPDLLGLDVNEHAYTVYDRASAVVGVLRRPGPDKPPEGFSCVLRTPFSKGTKFSAIAGPRGVFVATCKPDGKAALSEFDDAGKHLAHRELDASEIYPMALAGEHLFAVVEQRKLLILGHDLAEQAALDLVEVPRSQVIIRPHPDGKAALIALGDKLLRARLDGDSWTLTELDLGGVPEPGEAHQAEIPEAEIEEPDQPEAGPGDGRVRIITQAPRLSLNPQQPNDAWRFAANDKFEIVLNAVSVGGPATETGLYVEVSGDALDKGLLEPASVAIEGSNTGEATFVTVGKKRRAALPEFRLPAGVEPIKDKKVKPKERFLDNPEDTFVTVRLRGKTLAAGSQLLFVRVGFEGTEEGSLMRGRPFAVG